MMSKLNKNSIFLYFGIVAIIGYVINIIILGELEPNYSHTKQQISELGISNALNPLLFNLGEIVAGIFFLISSIGAFLVVFNYTKKKYLSMIFALCITFFGINFLFSGLFPLPDELHNGYGMGAFILLAPIFLAWSCWHIPMLNIFCYANLIAFLLLIMVMFLNIYFGSPDTLGLFQRVLVLSTFLWIFSVYTYLIKTNEHFN
jgi:hypothetical membrane protein